LARSGISAARRGHLLTPYFVYGPFAPKPLAGATAWVKV
jgi:hypothetical protein